MSDQELGISVTIDAELARFEAKMRDAGRVVEASTTDMNRSTRRAARSFNQLEAVLDPAARAAVRLERDTEKVQRALDKGVVSADRAAAVQRRLNDQYEQTIARLNGLGVASNQAGAAQVRLNAAATRSVAGTRRFGTIAQQAGFQVGDFAVQVASGQGAMRAFTQQGSQLLGVFGPIGAVLGAGIAVFGALSMALFSAGDAAEAAAAAQEEYNDIMTATEGLVERLNALGRERTQTVLDEAEAQRTANATLIETQTILARQAEQVLETLSSRQMARGARARTISDELAAALGVDDANFFQPGVQVRAQELQELLPSLTGRTADLVAQNEALAGAIEDARERLGRSAEATRAASDANDEFAESYNRLLERLDPTLAQQRELEEALGLLHEAYNRGAITLAEYAQLEDQVRDTFEGQAEAAEDTADRIADAGREAASVWATAFDRAARSVAQSLANSLFGLESASFDIRRFGAGIAGDFLTSAFQSVNPFAANDNGLSGFSGVGSFFQPNAFSVRGFDPLVNSINSFFNIGGPTAQIGTGLNQVGNAIAGNAAAPGSAGLFGLGSIGTAAGLGFGTAALGLLSGQGVGQSLLQGGLTGVGGLVGGPVGAAAGGLVGSLLGGLFGGGAPPDETAVFDVNLANRNAILTGSKNPSQEQIQGIQALSQQVFGLLDVLDALGGTIGVRGIDIGLSGKRTDFFELDNRRFETGTRSNIGAVESALLRELTPEIGGLSDPLQRVVNQSSASNFAALTQELAEAGQFLELYNSLVDQATLSEGEIAVKAIEEQFEALFEQAERLGLALEPLIELRDREIAALQEQASVQPQVLADTVAAGQAIRDFLNSQAVSDLSSLSPTQRLAEAQSQFGANLDQVRGGDLNAIGSLTQSATALLDIGRDQFASSVSFAALETTVRSSLAQLGVDLTSEGAIADRTAQAVEAQTATLVDTLDVLIDETVRVRQELASIKRDLRDAA